jgi:catechol 2,3-dioxygenase-like lactoylglutathione lyase family enzyme
MHMNHIDLHVADVIETADFLVRYFGLKLQEIRGNNFLAILHDDNGLEIVVSRPIEKLGGIEQQTLGAVTYHIGFIRKQRSDVDEIFEALSGSNAEIVGQPREMRGGYYFYLLAPGRILIEVGCRA